MGRARQPPTGAPTSIALIGNAAEIEPELVRRGERFDALTDQTSAHDALNGYVPAGLTLERGGRASSMLTRRPTSRRSMDSMAEQVRAMLALQSAGAVTFDYGNNIRAQAQAAGVDNAFDFPGFVPAFIRPLFCEGKGPFRWVALSGDPADIRRTDEAVLELFPENESLARWIRMAQERVPFQGLPARICWLGYGERAKAGAPLQRAGRLRRGQRADRHRSRPPRRRFGRLTQPRDRGHARRLRRDRRLAAPQRARQHVRRRELGVDPPRRRHGHRLLAARRHGRRRGWLGLSPPRSCERVLTTDPGMGVIRHADAGYERAIEVARERGVRVPMLEQD